MADKSISDIIKFVDPTGSIDDATVSSISRQLKFTEVLDLVSAVKKNDTETAKDILSKYDDTFSSATSEQPAQEAAIPPIKPTATTTGQSAFPKIQPQGQSNNLPGTANQAAAGQEDQDLNQLINDPTKQNDPNVRQLKSLLQKMGIQ